jgi:phosphatidylglycerol lysyltransferase
MAIGEQPVWQPAEWDAVLADPHARSLRYQLSRARKKGVTVREVTPGEVADPASPLHRAVHALSEAWLAGKGMAPMRFLVQLEPLGFADERVLLVAERAGAVVGFCSAVPVFARRRLFVEDLLRAPDAPNGTIELLVDAAMRAARTRGDDGVTLGLAPLAGDVAPLLRMARTLSAPLYDFRGLAAFKAKLRPQAWEPVYLCAAPGGSTAVALHDGLAAFAGGSLVGFAGRTLWRHRTAVIGAAIALVAIAALLLLLL